MRIVSGCRRRGAHRCLCLGLVVTSFVSLVPSFAAAPGTESTVFSLDDQPVLADRPFGSYLSSRFEQVSERLSSLLSARLASNLSGPGIGCIVGVAIAGKVAYLEDTPLSRSPGSLAGLALEFPAFVRRSSCLSASYRTKGFKRTWRKSMRGCPPEIEADGFVATPPEVTGRVAQARRFSHPRAGPPVPRSPGPPRYALPSRASPRARG